MLTVFDYKKVIGKKVYAINISGILTDVRELEDGNMILGYIDEKIIVNIILLSLYTTEKKLVTIDSFIKEGLEEYKEEVSEDKQEIEE
jgi:hypothetical protein